MICEMHLGLPSLHIPEYTSGVPRGGDDGILIHKSAAGEVPIMSSQFFGGSNHLLEKK